MPHQVQTDYGDMAKLRRIAAVEGYALIDKEDANDAREGRGSKSGVQVAELVGGLQ